MSIECRAAMAAVRHSSSGMVMQFLNATQRQLPALHRAIADLGLRHVHVSPAFLGLVIVQCPDEETASRLSEMITGLTPRAA